MGSRGAGRALWEHDDAPIEMQLQSHEYYYEEQHYMIVMQSDRKHEVPAGRAKPLTDSKVLLWSQSRTGDMGWLAAWRYLYNEAR